MRMYRAVEETDVGDVFYNPEYVRALQEELKRIRELIAVLAKETGSYELTLEMLEREQ